MSMMERVEGCPCGLTGVNCDVLVEGVEDPSDAMPDTCFMPGFDRCFVYQGEAKCICSCGYKGDFCEEESIPQVYNYVFGAIGSLSFIILVVYFIHRNYEKSLERKTLSEYHWPKDTYVTSHSRFVSPKGLLIWRASCAFLFWPVLILGLSRGGLTIFLAFTYHNWIMFGVIFSIGAYLSYLKVRDRIDGDERAGLLENTFLILLEIAVPTSLLIGLIFWILLLPNALANDERDSFLNFNSYVTHGVNTVLLFIEIYINKLHFVKSHVLYMLLWGAFYLLFHMFAMIIQSAVGDDHCPIYGFLSLDTPFFLIFIIGFMFAFTGFYSLVYMLMKDKRLNKGYSYQDAEENPLPPEDKSFRVEL